MQPPARVPPEPFELSLPADWRAVDFISDLHLSAALPQTVEVWGEHLRGTDADAVFMLGDLFEAWVGDDMLSLPFERKCAELLCEASARLQLAFMAGNRDFLLGAAMDEACNWMHLPDPTVIDAWGRRVLLTHGDALCLDDTDYQAFRAESRTPAWQQAFLSGTLVERMRRVAQVRAQAHSRRSTQNFDPQEWADVDTDAALAWLQRAGAADMVHGHTHRPGSHELAPGVTRHVLSDWDLDDHQRPRADLIRLTRDGFERRALVPAAR